VHGNRGGGKLEIDVSRSAALADVTDMAARRYFPSGHNESSGLSLENLEYFLATFTGKRIEEASTSSTDSSFGAFVDDLKTNPIRLYLHTKEKV